MKRVGASCASASRGRVGAGDEPFRNSQLADRLEPPTGSRLSPVLSAYVGAGFSGPPRSSFSFVLPDVSNPRHRLTEAVDELICLEVLDAAEHDDLRVDTALLEFRDPLLGRTNGLNLIVA